MIWLARELGMTPRRMLSEMTSLDLSEQLAYDQLLAEEAAAAKAGVNLSTRIPTPAEQTTALLAWRRARRLGR